MATPLQKRCFAGRIHEKNSRPHSLPVAVLSSAPCRWSSWTHAGAARPQAGVGRNDLEAGLAAESIRRFPVRWAAVVLCKANCSTVTSTFQSQTVTPQRARRPTSSALVLRIQPALSYRSSMSGKRNDTLRMKDLCAHGLAASSDPLLHPRRTSARRSQETGRNMACYGEAHRTDCADPSFVKKNDSCHPRDQSGAGGKRSIAERGAAAAAFRRETAPDRNQLGDLRRVGGAFAGV